MSDGYAGDKSPGDTFATLKADADAVLVDVRTVPEWQFVGVPDLADLAKEALFVEWQAYPEMKINAGFVEAVTAKGVTPDQTVFLLCRSGVRSKAAAKALTAAGFKACYNILEGFEGNADADGHRGKVGGWKHAGLPWRQQ
ncbi:MAG: rhodanese-like domain-containing protein [Minwuia sp.]|nr:rhodanese-like domain-containing protein [Minwuia sp.]